MDILLLLIPVTMILLAISGWLFWWTVKNGQYDDLDSPAQRILFDDDDDMIPLLSKPKPNQQADQRSDPTSKTNDD